MRPDGSREEEDEASDGDAEDMTDNADEVLSTATVSFQRFGLYLFTLLNTDSS